jgi:acyl-CoA reductase-like NAD-dependent aldehyde dehydrogenase
MESVNPATGEVIERFEPFGRDQVERALAQAYDAGQEWRETSSAEHGALLRRVAGVLRARKADLARTITREMGKVIGEAEAEVEKCAWNCDFYSARPLKFAICRGLGKGGQSREPQVCRRPLHAAGVGVRRDTGGDFKSNKEQAAGRGLAVG